MVSKKFSLDLLCTPFGVSQVVCMCSSLLILHQSLHSYFHGECYISSKSVVAQHRKFCLPLNH